jgi:pyruvate formate lyase activating enzyme
MDIKAPLEKYKEVTHSVISSEKIKSSIEIIMNSNIKYEFRTTVVKSQLSEEDIISIGKLIEGAELYILQKFIPSKTLDPNFLNEKTYSDGELGSLKRKLEKFVCRCLIR